MANEVTITVRGHDRTGGLFSGVSAKANSAFAKVNESIRSHMRTAVSQADQAARDIGQNIQNGVKAAFTSLPRLKVDADLSEAEAKIASLRQSLQALADKRIGVDIDVDQARSELAEIVENLRAIDRDSASVEVRADSAQALSQLVAVQEELDRLDGDTASADVDVDIGSALAQLHQVDEALDDIDGRTARAKVDIDSGGILAKAKQIGQQVAGNIAEGFGQLSSLGGPILAAGLLGVVTALGPQAGAALGGGLVLGFGASLVGLASMAHMHIEEIDKDWEESEKKRAERLNKSAEALAKSWRDFNRDLIEGMREVSQPIVSIFDTIKSSLRDLGNELKPTLSGVFKDMAGPLNDFIKNFIGALKEIKPALSPITEAFNGILSTLGPAMKVVFRDIASSLKDLAQVVVENKTAISGLFVGLLETIPLAISLIAQLTSAFSGLLSFANSMGPSFTHALVAVLSSVERLLSSLRAVGEVMSHMPGMEALGRTLVEGIDRAIGKVQEWKREAEVFNRKVEIQADINDLTMKLDQAKAKLTDPELTKERRAELTAEITKLETAKAKAIQELGDPKLVAEYRSKLTTDIATLQERINTARKELKDPELTKERKSKLNADIAALQAQVSAAKAALNSIPDKTVTVTVRTVGNESIYQAGKVTASTRARGGIIGAAGGGPRSNMTLVGEQGPELVRLPFGSTVIPNGQSERMLSGGGGSGVTVNLFVQGSIRSDRDLIQLIRDEFVNGGFRGALTNA